MMPSSEQAMRPAEQHLAALGDMHDARDRREKDSNGDGIEGRDRRGICDCYH